MSQELLNELRMASDHLVKAANRASVASFPVQAYQEQIEAAVDCVNQIADKVHSIMQGGK
jgi:RecA-family ATPase